MAADIVQKDIRVSYLPLKFMFDGVEKAPPADQQGFTYNGRTYVPLRFVGEALGKKVDYDANTFTIYLGRRSAALPAFWQTFRTEGDANIKMEYYTAGMMNKAGVEMPDSLFISALAAQNQDPAKIDFTTVVSTEVALDGKYRTLSGMFFVPDNYLGRPGERKLGHLTILNEANKPIFKSTELTTLSDAIPFSISVSDVQKIRILVSVYHNHGYPTGTELLGTHLGLSNLKWE